MNKKLTYKQLVEIKEANDLVFLVLSMIILFQIVLMAFIAAGVC